MALRLRRGTDAERLLITPVEGELIYTTDTKLLYVGDGSTAGGTLVTGAGGGGGSTTLAALTDTDVAGVLDNQVLTWIAGTNKWEPTTLPGVGALSLDDLTNVTGTTGAGIGDALVYDGLEFRPYALSNLFQEQQDYKINIVGDDSTILVNTDNNTITGRIIGDVIGDLDGSVIGNVTGNVLGDLQGSVFADDSTILVDGINNNFNGNLLTISGINTTSIGPFEIGTLDDPIPLLNVNSLSNLTLNQVISPGNLKGYVSIVTGRGTHKLPEAVQADDEIGGIIMQAYTDSVSDPAIGGILGWFVDSTSSVTPGSQYIKTNVILSAATDTTQDPENVFLLTSEGVATSNVFSASKYMQLPVFADDTARTAAIPTPAKGMMVFMETGTVPAATNQMQVFDGTNWVNAS